MEWSFDKWALSDRNQHVSYRISSISSKPSSHASFDEQGQPGASRTLSPSVATFQIVLLVSLPI